MKLTECTRSLFFMAMQIYVNIDNFLPYEENDEVPSKITGINIVYPKKRKFL
jgi:hypothetical protein